MDEGQNPAPQTNQSEEIPQGEGMTEDKRQQSDPGVRQGGMQEETPGGAKGPSPSVNNTPGSKEAENKELGGNLTQQSPQKSQVPLVETITPLPVKLPNEGLMQVEDNQGERNTQQGRMEVEQDSSLRPDNEHQSLPNVQKISFEVPPGTSSSQVHIIKPVNTNPINPPAS